jgi:hypothetical protein
VKLSDSQEFAKLESLFPRIAARIEYLWGSTDGREYLHSLIVDERQDRQGFPFETFLCLSRLLDDHDREFPGKRPKMDPWEKNKFV